MYSQVVRLRSRQMLIRLLHALHRLLEAGVAARVPASKGTHLGNPLAHAHRCRTMSGAARRRPKPFNGHQLLDTIWIDPTVLTGDGSTQRVTDDGNGKHLQLFEELRHIQYIIDHGVLPPPRPLRVPVPTQIRGNDVIGIAEGQGYPVPVTSMIAPPMNKEQWWGRGVTPVH